MCILSQTNGTNHKFWVIFALRDGRYGVPRTSLPADEQHRIQQYNQMLSGRNIQQSNLTLPGAVSGSDRGIRMLPSANGMGMMCGINRSMPKSRPGFQGMASSAMLNSGSMLSSNMVGMPSPVNMNSGPGSGQGNSMLRPHDTMHMMRVSYLLFKEQYDQVYASTNYCSLGFFYSI